MAVLTPCMLCVAPKQAHPGLMAASTPWLSGQDYKRLCAWLPYVSTVLVLVRDKGSGRVKLGKDGLPRLHYWPDAHDRASLVKVGPACKALPLPGVLRCMHACCLRGAHEHPAPARHWG